MALPFYTAWKTMSSTPSEYWKNGLQALIDEQFENASNIYTIQKKNNLTGLYEDIIVRLEIPYELKQISTKTDDYRKIIFKNNSISTLIGDYYKFNNSYWMCTDDNKIETPTNSCIIQRCNNTLSILKNNILHHIPCIIESNVRFQDLRVEESKFINIPDDKITARIPNNEITKDISRNLIFKLNEYDNYKIISVNRVTEPGLIVLKMEFVAEEAIEHNFVVEILNGDSIEISQFQLLTINIQVTDNGEIVSSPALLYSSSDETIAIINEEGVVTILSVGTVTFSVCLASDQSVSDSIVVEVVADEEEQHNYTAEISGSNSIIKDKSANYTCIFKDNGVQMSGISSIFYLTSDDGVSSTNLASISSQDSVANSCVVTAGSALGYVKLWVKNNDETIASSSFRIQIKNIF